MLRRPRQRFRQEVMRAVAVRIEGKAQPGGDQDSANTEVEDEGVRMDVDGMRRMEGPLGRQNTGGQMWEGM